MIYDKFITDSTTSTQAALWSTLACDVVTAASSDGYQTKSKGILCHYQCSVLMSGRPGVCSLLSVPSCCRRGAAALTDER